MQSHARPPLNAKRLCHLPKPQCHVVCLPGHHHLSRSSFCPSPSSNPPPSALFQLTCATTLVGAFGRAGAACTPPSPATWGTAPPVPPSLSQGLLQLSVPAGTGRKATYSLGLNDDSVVYVGICCLCKNVLFMQESLVCAGIPHHYVELESC